MVMKADLRISIKDYRRNKLLRVTLARVPFGQRQFFVRMDGKRWAGFGAAGVHHTGHDGLAQGAGGASVR